MRTAVVVEPTAFELQDRDRPEPGPDDVLVAIRDVGICGSDVHYYEHGRIGITSSRTPSSSATRAPARSSRSARTSPDSNPATGSRWNPAFPAADASTASEGALCEPLSVGIHACRRGDVGTGDSVLVAGAGPIGLMIAEAARAAGATDVIMTDVVPEKLEFARERGIDLATDVTETDFEATVDEYTDGIGADVVLEASGAEPSITSTLDVVRRGGTVVLFGLADEAEVSFDVLDVIDNELDVHGSFRYKNTPDAAIDLLAGGVVDVEGIVDFESSLSEIDDAFRRAMEPNVVKGMISFDDP